MISVLFFASLSETLKCKKIEYPKTDEISTVADLVLALSAKGEHWQQALTKANIIVAVNQSVAKATTEVGESDEVAFYPPVSGG